MLFKINFWRIIGIIALIAMTVVFFNIVVYMVIASILFLIGSPITRKLESIRIRGKNIPDSLSAMLTLLILVGLFVFLFALIFPPLIKQVNVLSALNFYDVLHGILLQFPSLNEAFSSIGNTNDIKLALSSQLTSFLNFNNFSLILNNIISYAGSILGGGMCVLFIAFFLLKDETLIKNSILTITPSEYEKEVREILTTSKKMLSKYFGALFLDMLLVGLVVGLMMKILGIENALIIGFTAGLLNVVPYIGPAITMVVAVFLGVSGCIAAEEYDLIQLVITKIVVSLFIINISDGFILQPLLFSSSVKAHPLEVFIVTLMGAILGGIPGMIMALPAYTILRIIAREFLSQFKVFKQLTEKLND
jgi:predicted PurR-regulated permease PerM